MSKNFFNIFFFSLLFLACKKNDTKGIEPIKYTATISLLKAEPGEQATIRFSQAIKKEVLSVNLNTVPIKAYPLNDSIYSFIVPVIAPGDYNVTFQDLPLLSKLNLSIVSYPIITQAQPIVDSFSNAVNKSIDSLVKLSNSPVAPINKVIIPFVKQFQEELNTSYASLTTEEKVQFAYFVRQNKIDFSSLTSSTLPPLFYNNSIDNFRDPGEELIKVSQEFAARVVIAVGTIPVLLGSAGLFIYSPTPFTATLLSASFLGYIIAREAASKKGAEVGKLNGVVETLTDIFSSNQNNSTQFIKNLQSEISILSTHSIPSFKPNVPKIITFKVEFRNLIKTDVGLHNNITAAIKSDEDIVAEDKNIELKFAKAKTLLKKVNLDWVSFTSKIPNSIIKKVAYSVPASSIVLKSISDNRLTYTSTNLDTGISVRVNSAIAQNIDFNLSIGYKSNLINKNIEKTFPAKFLGAIDTAAVLVSHGKWQAISGTDKDGVPVNVQRTNFGNMVGGTRVCADVLTAKYIDSTDIQFFDGVLKNGTLNQSENGEQMNPFPTLPNCSPSPFGKVKSIDADTFEWQYLPSLKVIRIKITTPNNRGLADTGVFLDLKIISFSSSKMELEFINGIDNAPASKMRYVFN